MEQNLPIVTKKFLKIARLIYFTLRKGISNVKLLADLNIIMNPAKIAGILHNLLFHHHPTAAENHLSHPVPLHEYEFSCNNSPAYRNFLIPFHLNKRKHRHEPSDAVLMAAALEMAANSASASPALPGFGRTPIVRQLRITDSPFPLSNIEENCHVDEAAEEFIKRFHRDLRAEQNGVALLESYCGIVLLL